MPAQHSGIAVVIPCYKVIKHVDDLFGRFGPEVDAIYAVDDQCPEGSGTYIEKTGTDPRVRVIYNPENLGVGRAVLDGMKAARDDGYAIGVKIDGDGQMGPALIRKFVRPIQMGLADYTEGNRFYDKDVRLNSARTPCSLWVRKSWCPIQCLMEPNRCSTAPLRRAITSVRTASRAAMRSSTASPS
ncbi:glycosyltransferase [uncultured Algimonas sp.]|uniref:glycosyltransferase n=1 Tax=uncultured Algimonas sp. TaxID=1547920 RepID=UPI00261E4B0B|nr:glycosyltransferase [uncultured Algimonas sp.]